MDYFKGVITEMSTGDNKHGCHRYEKIKIGNRILDNLKIESDMRGLLETACSDNSEIGVYVTSGIIVCIEKDGQSHVVRYTQHIIFFIMLAAFLCLSVILIGLLLLPIPLICMAKTYGMNKSIEKISVHNPVYYKSLVPMS